MSLSGITFGGLASGIDTNSIVSRLVQLEAVPISRLQKQQQEIEQRRSVYGELKSRLSTFAQAAGSMNVADAFNPVTAGSSDMGVAILSGTSGATAGTYNLSVSKLAKANKVATTPKSDTTSALGLTAGTFVVNGKSVAVDETDSLRSIAQKVNAASAGVTASLIDGGSGNAYLTLTAGSTGASNRIQLGDFEGSVLGQLGMTTGTSSVRETITNGATSANFKSANDSIKSLLGTSTSGGTSFSINGEAITVDLSTDGLQGIADKINASTSGANATVRSKIVDGTTYYKLDISGTTTPTFDDPNHVLESIGVLQKAAGNELVGAQDAEYKLDNVSLTSSTNTIKDVIPGATLTLSKADATTPTTSVLTLSRDNTAIKGKIKAFSDAYNSLNDFITGNSKYDADTLSSGPLLGDTTSQQIESAMSSMLFNNVPGLTGAYKNMADIGFKFDDKGNLTADDAILNAAIAADAEAVGAVFRSTGSGSNDNIKYVSATSTTKASGAGSYAVNVTQIATRGKATANLAQLTASSVSEKLTFSGSLFGSTPYALNLDIGSTLSSTVNKINTDSKLKDMIAASVVDGKLTLTSRRYGTANNFTVASNIAEGTDNSGIGYGGAVIVNGVDIEGTINGNAAVGAGQFLTGNTAAGDSAGLQIQYTGSDLGAVGSIQFRKGVGTQANDLVGTFTDAVYGLLTTADKSMQDQIDGIGTQITDLNTRLTERTTELKTRFAAMEAAIAQAQSQTTSLAALSKSYSTN